MMSLKIACLGLILLVAPVSYAQTRSTYAFELNALKDKYNVLNHHNPFSVINDDRSREWRQVSLIPIMPCFSYRIQF